MDQFLQKRAETDKKKTPRTLDIEPDDKTFPQIGFLNKLMASADPDIDQEVEEIIDVEGVEETEAREEGTPGKNSKIAKGFNGKPKDKEEKSDDALPLNEKVYNNQKIEITTEKKSEENDRTKDPQIDKMSASDKTPSADKTAEKENDKICDSSSRSFFDGNQKKYETRCSKSRKTDNFHVVKMADAGEKISKDVRPDSSFLQRNDKNQKTRSTKFGKPEETLSNDKTDAKVFLGIEETEEEKKTSNNSEITAAILEKTEESRSNPTTEDCKKLENYGTHTGTDLLQDEIKETKSGMEAVKDPKTEEEANKKQMNYTSLHSGKTDNAARSPQIEESEEKNKSCKVSIPIEHYEKYLCAAGKSDHENPPKEDLPQNRTEDCLKKVVFSILKKEKNAKTVNLRKEDMKIKVKIIQKYFESYLDSLAAQSGIISKFVQEKIEETENRADSVGKTENPEIDQAENRKENLKQIVFHVSKNNKNKNLQKEDPKIKVKIIEKYFKSYLDSLDVPCSSTSNLVKENIEETEKVRNKSEEIVEENIDQTQNSGNCQKQISFYVSKNNKNKNPQEENPKMKIKIIEKYFKSYLDSLDVPCSSTLNLVKNNIKETQKGENKDVKTEETVEEKIDQAENRGESLKQIIFHVSKNNKNKDLQEKDTKIKVKIIEKYFKSYLNSFDVSFSSTSNLVKNNIKETEKTRNKSEEIVEEKIDQAQNSGESLKQIIFYVSKNTKNKNLQEENPKMKVKIIEKYFKSYLNSLDVPFLSTSNLPKDNIKETEKVRNKSEEIVEEKSDQTKNSRKIIFYVSKNNKNENLQEKDKKIKIKIIEKYFKSYLDSLEVPSCITLNLVKDNIKETKKVGKKAVKTGKIEENMKIIPNSNCMRTVSGQPIETKAEDSNNSSKDIIFHKGKNQKNAKTQNLQEKNAKIKIKILGKYYINYLDSLAVRAGIASNSIHTDIKETEEKENKQITTTEEEKIDDENPIKVFLKKPENEMSKNLKKKNSWIKVMVPQQYYDNFLHSIELNVPQSTATANFRDSFKKPENMPVYLERPEKDVNGQDTRIKVTVLQKYYEKHLRITETIESLSAQSNPLVLKKTQEINSPGKDSKNEKKSRIKMDKVDSAEQKAIDSKIAKISEPKNQVCNEEIKPRVLEETEDEAVIKEDNCQDSNVSITDQEEIKHLSSKNSSLKRSSIEFEEVNRVPTTPDFNETIRKKFDQLVDTMAKFCQSHDDPQINHPDCDTSLPETKDKSEDLEAKSAQAKPKPDGAQKVFVFEGRNEENLHQVVEACKTTDVSSFDLKPVKRLKTSEESQSKKGIDQEERNNITVEEMKLAENQKAANISEAGIEDLESANVVLPDIFYNKNTQQFEVSRSSRVEEVDEENQETDQVKKPGGKVVKHETQTVATQMADSNKNSRYSSNSLKNFVDTKSQATIDLLEKLNTPMITKSTIAEEPIHKRRTETSNSSVKLEPDEDLSAKSKKDATFKLLRQISDDLKKQLEEIQKVHTNFKNTIEAFDALIAKLFKM